MTDDTATPGVYRRGLGGRLSLVHEYLDESYELADISELLGIGTAQDDNSTLRLEHRQRRLLKVTADAQSFDHAPEFITMCTDIASLEVEPDDTTVHLVSIA